jgi:hypothetical protein
MLDARLPIARGASDSFAVALEDLFRARFRRDDVIRAHLVLDPGAAFSPLAGCASAKRRHRHGTWRPQVS